MKMTTVEEGIYQDRYGFYVRARVGSAPNVRSQQRRFPHGTDREVMRAWRLRALARLVDPAGQCACGCGSVVAVTWKRGHQSRVRGRSTETPEEERAKAHPVDPVERPPSASAAVPEDKVPAPMAVRAVQDALERAKAGELLGPHEIAAIWRISVSQFYRLNRLGAFDVLKTRPAIGARCFSGVKVSRYLNGEGVYPELSFGRKRGAK